MQLSDNMKAFGGIQDRAAQEVSIDAFIATYDIDGDGTVDLSEWLDYFSKIFDRSIDVTMETQEQELEMEIEDQEEDQEQQLEQVLNQEQLEQ